MKGSSMSLATSFMAQYVLTVSTDSTTASGMLGTYATTMTGSMNVNAMSSTSTNWAQAKGKGMLATLRL